MILSRHFAIWLAFLLLTLGLAFENLNRDYVLDNKWIATMNQFVIKADYLSLWTSPYWGGVPKVTPEENLYRPIFLTVFTLLQKAPWALNFLSLLAITGVGWLFWVVLGSLGIQSDVWRSLGTALFLFHPANVEISAQVIGLQESVPALLGIGALLISRSSPAIAVALASLAPGWKETGFAWLGGLLGIFAYRRQKNAAVACFVGICFWLLARQAACGSFFSSTRTPHALSNPLAEMEFFDAFFTRIALIGHHLRVFFFPFALTSDYSRGTLPLPGYPIQVWVLVGAAFLYALVVNYRKIPAYAWLAMAPVIPTLHVLGPLEIIFAERFGLGMRFAFVIFLMLALQEVLPKFSSQDRKRVAGVLFGIVILFYCLTYIRFGEWSSEKNLFASDLRKYPRNPRLHYYLGMAHGGEKEWSDAEAHFRIATELDPLFPEAHFRLGIVLRHLKRESEAQASWATAEALGHPVERSQQTPLVK